MARARLRAAAARTRRRARLATLGLIAAPIALAALYGATIATPRYATESRFSVRASSAGQAGAGQPAGIIATGPQATAGFVDGWAVSDFLNSRDCMRALGHKLDLRRLLSHDGVDPIGKLAPDASEEQLYRAYTRSVGVSYNMLEQIDVMKVSAFSPADGERISHALLEIAQQFVNNMDEHGRADALDVARQSVLRAERADMAALAAVARWRGANGNIDPAADAGMLLGVVGQLETQLTTAQVELDKVEVLGNPDHPLLRPAQQQVAAIRERLRATRARMSGKGDTEAAQIKTYEGLKNAQAFADANLAAARQGFQQAFTDTLRMQLYLSVIARPVSGDEPSSPNMVTLLLEALALGLVLAFAWSLVAGAYRGLANG